jgi:hypothetical protein
MLSSGPDSHLDEVAWSLEASALGSTWVSPASLVSDEVAAQAEGS